MTNEEMTANAALHAWIADCGKDAITDRDKEVFLEAHRRGQRSKKSNDVPIGAMDRERRPLGWQRHWDNYRAWAAVVTREKIRDSCDVWVVRVEGPPGKLGEVLRLSDGRKLQQVPGGVTQPTREQARTLRVSYMEEKKVRRITARDLWDYDDDYCTRWY